MDNIIKDIDQFIINNNISVIFCDIDGVLWHSCQAIIDILNEKYGGNFTGSDVTSWNVNCCYPKMTEEEVEGVFNNPKFFEIVKPVDGALEFLDRYRDKIILVTKASVENYVLKRKWFDGRGFSSTPIIALPLNVSKGFIDMQNCTGLYGYSLFIDDSTNNLQEVNADICVMFKEYNDKKEREWQKGWCDAVMYWW
jgi:5'(3')-deoxyribonucleotidase